ncbi:MAG TPA: fumarylacetoacetate hydrolase family protein [Pseudonocardia sp.]|nr:fumarylacetoacetate hydrolase family protein [Pseudonocardia sp.]
MSPDPARALAAEIDAAHRERRLLDAAGRALDLETAYAAQRELTALRTARGARRIGWKLGYTSEAMRAQMGVAEPNAGPLLDSMLVPDGGRVPEALVHPRVEPEIALRVGPDGAPEAALAALEIVDSVWRDYRFTLETNTADGSSAAGVVLGPELPLDGLDTLPVELRHNGTPAGMATGAAAMGHPRSAFDWLAGRLAQWGERLEPGDVVITGGLTVAVALEPGDAVEAAFGDDVVVRTHR